MNKRLRCQRLMIPTSKLLGGVIAAIMIGTTPYATAQVPGGGAHQMEVHAVSPTRVRIDYQLERDYPGFQDRVYVEMFFRGGRLVDQVPASGTEGEHSVFVDLSQTQGFFSFRLVLDEMVGDPWGWIMSFTLHEGTAYPLDYGELIGHTPLQATWLRPLSGCGPCFSSGCTELCPAPPAVTPGYSVFCSPVPTAPLDSIHYRPPSGAVAGCGDCQAISNPGSFRHPMLTAHVRMYWLPQDPITAGSFSPGFFTNYDTQGYFALADDESIVGRIFDAEQATTITFYDRSEDNPRDGVLYADHYPHVRHIEVLDGDGQRVIRLRDAVAAILHRWDGTTYSFELYEPRDGDRELDLEARLTEIRDRNGYSTTISYRQERQIENVVDAHGDTLTFHYAGDQQSGRWSVARIDLPTGATLGYSYEDGRLSSVALPDGSEARFSYGIDESAQTAFIEWNDPSSIDVRRQRMQCHVTQDYSTLEQGDVNVVINQPSGVFRQMRTPLGENHLALFVSPHDPNKWIVWKGTNTLLLVYNGVGVAHFTQWSVGNPQDGYSAFSGDVESTFAVNLNAGTHLQDEVPGQPPVINDDGGYQYQLTYDSDGRLAERRYGDGTFETYAYNDGNQLTRHRDRLGRVTRFEYDSRGNLVKRCEGILESNGLDVEQPEYAELCFEYYPSGHPHAHLLKSKSGPANPSSGGQTPRTDYTYDERLRLIAIQHPGGADQIRPTQSLHYDSIGRMVATNDAAGRQTRFRYDALGRLIETTFPDGSTEQFRFGAAGGSGSGLVVMRKDRRNVVTTIEFDEQSRPTSTTEGAGWDHDILDGARIDEPNLDSNSRRLTTYTYLSGNESPQEVRVNGALTTYEFDYRNRIVATHKRSRVGAQRTERRGYFRNQLQYRQDPWGRRFYRGHRASDGGLIRTVEETLPGSVAQTGLGVLQIQRDPRANARYLISDALKDSVGQVVEVIDGRGVATICQYDSRGHRTRCTVAAGLNAESTTEYDFDARGLPVEIRHPRFFDPDDPAYGIARTRFAYDPRGNRIRQWNAPGSEVQTVESWEYSIDDKVVGWLDPLGNHWTTQWHACCGRRQGQRNPLGHGDFSNFDALGNATHRAKVSQHDSHSNAHDPVDGDTLYEETGRFDALGRLSARTVWLQPIGQVDAKNPPIAGDEGSAAELGLTTRYFYDRNLTDGVGADSTSGLSIRLAGGESTQLSLTHLIQRLARPVSEGGAETVFAADCPGSAIVIVSPADRIEVTLYDALDRVVASARLDRHDAHPPFATLQWNCHRYDESAEVAGFGICVENQSIDGAGSVNAVRMDGAGRVLEWVNATGGHAVADYDSNGNRLSFRMAQGMDIDSAYDATNRLISRSDSAGRTATYGWDRAGNLIRAVDPKGNVSTAHFDAIGRRVRLVDRRAGATEFDYDPNGNLIAVTDAAGQVTRYEYDSLGARILTTYPGHAAGSLPDQLGFDQVATQWDPAGRILARINQKGQTCDHHHDLSGRLLSREYRSVGSARTDLPIDRHAFEYDRDGKLIAALRQDGGNEIRFTYDGAARLASETLTWSGHQWTCRFAHDLSGRLTRIEYPLGHEVQRQYSATGQLESIHLEGQLIESREYDSTGRLTRQQRSNGRHIARSYAADGSLAGLQWGDSDAAHYLFDEHQNRTELRLTGVMTHWGQQIGDSGFDAEDQIVSWRRSDGTDEHQWQRNLVGEPEAIARADHTDRFTYAAGHRLDGFNGYPIEHDPCGNLVRDDLQRAFFWGSENELQAVDVDGDQHVDVEYVYDALGRRIARISDDGPTAFVHGGWQVLSEIPLEEDHSSKAYVYGAHLDEIVVSVLGDQRRFFDVDGQNSVVALSNDVGAVVERYVYDAHGRPYFFDASGVSREESAESNPWLFTGRRWDPLTRLYDFRSRSYEPRWGRFISRDPAGYVDGFSLYQGYFLPDGTDPFGQCEAARGREFIEWVLLGVDPSLLIGQAYDRLKFEIGRGTLRTRPFGDLPASLPIPSWEQFLYDLKKSSGLFPFLFDLGGRPDVPFTEISLEALRQITMEDVLDGIFSRLLKMYDKRHRAIMPRYVATRKTPFGKDDCDMTRPEASHLTADIVFQGMVEFDFRWVESQFVFADEYEIKRNRRIGPDHPDFEKSTIVDEQAHVELRPVITLGIDFEFSAFTLTIPLVQRVVLTPRDSNLKKILRCTEGVKQSED